MPETLKRLLLGMFWVDFLRKNASVWSPTFKFNCRDKVSEIKTSSLIAFEKSGKLPSILKGSRLDHLKSEETPLNKTPSKSESFLTSQPLMQ